MFFIHGMKLFKGHFVLSTTRLIGSGSLKILSPPQIFLPTEKVAMSKVCYNGRGVR